MITLSPYDLKSLSSGEILVTEDSEGNDIEIVVDFESDDFDVSGDDD